jgi:hypothetical protein
MPYTFQNMDVPGAASGTTAEGINNQGQVTGSYTVGFPSDPYPQAYVETLTGPDSSRSGQAHTGRSHMASTSIISARWSDSLATIPANSTWVHSEHRRHVYSQLNICASIRRFTLTVSTIMEMLSAKAQPLRRFLLSRVRLEERQHQIHLKVPGASHIR